MKALLPFAALLLACVPAHAESASDNGSDVQQLYYWCQEPAGTGHWYYCLGTLKGMSVAMAVTGVDLQDGSLVATGRTIALCVPEGEKTPTGGASLQSFLNYAKAHPEDWSLPAEVGIMRAFMATWPCDK